ncbi:MAG TPA: extradiol ring-cleavage dioxygenase [Clostridiales bacterium]|nr:extradiol ring-cleavage dioxygenase [Clostridiales bacterium]
MAILNAIMAPHPPLILPQVGRGEEKSIQATVDAYRTASRFVAEAAPDTVVITTPHSVMYADWFHISPGRGASGSFSQFRASEVRVSADYDTEFVDTLCRMAREQKFPAGTEGEKSPELDHAAMIPLYFLNEAYGGKPLPPIVRIGLSGLPLYEHYRLGMMIRGAAEKLGRRISFVASGDLSHRLKEDGPYGFRAEGPAYDKRIMDVMGRAAFGELFDFSDAFCDSAGECGHRSFTIMAGCFDGQAVTGRALSYEGPFGVGYGVCAFTPGAADESRHFLDEALRRENERLKSRKAGEDEYVRLARLSVETFVRTRQGARLPPDVSEELTSRRAGVFTTLYKNGQLRGCIGTTAPTTENVAQEILQNGISACSRDPRFPPVTEAELPYLEYSVDVLGAPEEIASPAQLDVKRYGVIVSCGGRRGLLLPDLDGVDSVEEQIAIARRKGGISAGERVRLQRFEVVRHV